MELSDGRPPLEEAEGGEAFGYESGFFVGFRRRPRLWRERR